MTVRKTDRRSRRSQRLIGDALLALMMEKRFERITVQEILDRADVGRSTFYAQFRNTEDVLAFALEQIFSQLHDQHLASSVTPADGLLPSLELFRHVQAIHSLYPSLIRGLAHDAHAQTVHQVLRGLAARQLARISGSHDLTVPPDLVADYLAGTLLTIIHWWLDCRSPATPEQIEAYFQHLIMPGINAMTHQSPACPSLPH